MVVTEQKEYEYFNPSLFVPGLWLDVK